MSYLDQPPESQEKKSIIGPTVGGIAGFAFLCGMASLAFFLHKRTQNKEVQKRRRLEFIMQDLDKQILNMNVVRMIQNAQRNIYFPVELVLQQSLVDLYSDVLFYQNVPEKGKV